MKTINLEQAKKLKQLGFERESEYNFASSLKHNGNYSSYELRNSNEIIGFQDDKTINAYTLDELGEILKYKEDYLYYSNIQIKWISKHELSCLIGTGKTQIEARYNLLVQLIGKGVIS